MRILFIIAVVGALSCLSAELTAQNRRMQLKGSVADRVTHAPLTGVNITIGGTRRGTNTNQEGAFAITIYNLPVNVSVSYVGYETQRLWLDDLSVPVAILLNPATSQLQEIEIKAKNDPVPFFRDHQYAVLDYEVDSGIVYILNYKNRLVNSMVLCKSPEGDTVAHSGLLQFKPVALFRDCLGNIHVLSADSAYQLYISGSHAGLLYPNPIRRFEATLPGCVASSGRWLFFRKATPDGQTVQFTAIDRLTSHEKFIQASQDEEKVVSLRRSPYDLFLLMLDTIPDDFSTATYMQWLKKIIYKPNTTSLYKIDDLAGVFNTVDHTLALYTLAGDFTSKLKLPVDKITEGKWTYEIYVDDMEHKAYTSFRKGGLFTIYCIDLNTGELKLQLSAVHNFPLKIRVHNGFLYYLYDVPGPNDNRHIFRQKL
jgi:hypothetical protein